MNNSVALTVEKLNESLNILVKLVQKDVFYTEIHNLSSKNKLLNSSKILNLNPFLDSHGILRVGGRYETLILILIKNILSYCRININLQI